MSVSAAKITNTIPSTRTVSKYSSLFLIILVIRVSYFLIFSGYKREKTPINNMIAPMTRSGIVWFEFIRQTLPFKTLKQTISGLVMYGNANKNGGCARRKSFFLMVAGGRLELPTSGL